MNKNWHKIQFKAAKILNSANRDRNRNPKTSPICPLQSNATPLWSIVVILGSVGVAGSYLSHHLLTPSVEQRDWMIDTLLGPSTMSLKQ